MNINNKLLSWVSSNTGTFILFVLWSLFITDLWLPRNWGFYGTGDWDLTYTTYEVARKSIIEFGQFPHYNPFLAFGSDLDANPQAAHFSIFFLPILAFGTFYGYKVSIVLAILLGLLGCHRLLRTIGSEIFPSIMLSMILCSAPYFGRHIIEAGHSNFLNFYLIPALFWLYLRYMKSGKFSQLSLPVLILVQFICGGAPFVFIISVVILLLWLTGSIFNRDLSIKKALFMLTSIGFAIGLSLWKLIPVLDLWSDSPRLVNDDSKINLLVWLHALNDTTTDTGTPHGWHEVSLGISLFLPLLIVVYRKYIPNFKTWLVLTAFVIWLSLGNQPDFFNPWYLIHHTLPFFNGLRAPYRFAFILVFAILIGATLVITKLKDNNLIYIILFSITLSNTLNFNALSRNMVHTPRIEDVPKDTTSKFAIRNLGNSYPFHFLSLKKNQFLISAYEPLHLPSVNDTLESLVKGGELKYFSPQFISIQSNDSITTLSLRWDKGWSTGDNAKINNQNGLIVLKSMPNSEIQLKYSNPSFYIGLNYSLIVLLFFLLCFYPFRFLQIVTETVINS